MGRRDRERGKVERIVSLEILCVVLSISLTRNEPDHIFYLGHVTLYFLLVSTFSLLLTSRHYIGSYPGLPGPCDLAVLEI
jgi:hypothetical protein